MKRRAVDILATHFTTSVDALTFLQNQGHAVALRGWRSLAERPAALDALFGDDTLRRCVEFPIQCTQLDAVQAYDHAVYEELAGRFAKEKDIGNTRYLYCTYKPCFAHLLHQCSPRILLNQCFRLEGNYPTTPRSFDRLIDTILRMVDTGQLIPFAASHYDRAYFKYFTGLDAELFPLVCPYVWDLAWQADKIDGDEILVFPGRHKGHHHDLCESYVRWFARHADIKLTTPERKYGHLSPKRLLKWGYQFVRHGRSSFAPHAYHGYQYHAIIKNKAIVFFPYSTMAGTMYEWAQMGIPMFFPSKQLMLREQRRYNFLPERTSRGPARSRGHFATLAHGRKDLPDPNDDFDEDALNFWFGECEWFKWNVTFFDSPEDLYAKLKAADLEQMNKDLLQTAAQMRQQHHARWRRLL